MITEAERALRVGKSVARKRRRFHYRVMPYEEIESVAIEAAWRAVASHDPEQGTLEYWMTVKAAWAIRDAHRARTGRGPTDPKTRIRRNLLSPFSLDAEVKSDFGPATYNDVFVAPEPDDPGELVIARLTEKIATVLTEQEKRVFAMLVDGFSLSEIGDQFGFTEARACQIRRSIKKKTAAKWGDRLAGLFN
jgi:RNA polymerase sigma factor (sigma-70 family)